ncbi:hypothetical protein ACSSVZ_004651 [Amorphus sp. MBR-141]
MMPVDVLAGEALSPEADDCGLHLRCRGRPQTPGPRRAVLEAGKAFRPVARQPFARRARANACVTCGGLRRLPTKHCLHHPLSTVRRQTGIVMDVYSGLYPSAVEALQLQSPRSGPNGQPIETPQLEPFLVRWNHLTDKKWLQNQYLEQFLLVQIASI